MWTLEHGSRCGDELNHPEAGKNYGWPVITYGVDYNGTIIGEGTSKPGMEQPVYYWAPVIAPSGMTFYTGKTSPEWNGSLFVGSLNPGLLVRLTLDGTRVVCEERYLSELKSRLREAQHGPDGRLSLLTDRMMERSFESQTLDKVLPIPRTASAGQPREAMSVARVFNPCSS
ncbi:MAG: PQQ-dependent sugar dehydrogenase [Nitrospira sp.]|nr:PQQ-dependent sugar dehydrogenase [Nitrospira sp.]